MCPPYHAARMTFAAAVIAVLASSSLSTAQQPAQNQPATRAAPDAAAPTVVVPATVAAFYMADLYAKDSGYLSEVKADIGDHVTKGQVLAIIDDPELQQHFIGVEATLASKAELVKAA